jgi:hypothetical protein
MVAVDTTRAGLILNCTLPCGAAGIPGTALVTMGAGAMFLLLTSTASTQAAAGTQITNGTGYTTNGLAFSNPCAGASGGPPPQVTMPATAAMSWTASGANFAVIQSLEIQGSGQIRGFFGNWNGAPIAVASGNTFQVAIAAIVATGF